MVNIFIDDVLKNVTFEEKKRRSKKKIFMKDKKRNKNDSIYIDK